MTLVFLDTNVPMYAGGGPHALREPCERVLLLVAEMPGLFVTDAEVLQEMLHRYRAQNLWYRGGGVFHRFARLMRGRIEAIGVADVEQAALLADEYIGLSARDLLHVAVMARVGAETVITADRGFDRVPQVRRLDPVVAPAWVRDYVGKDGA